MKMRPVSSSSAKKPKSGRHGVSPLAVIIPTKNRPREVETLLSTMEKQTLRPAQVIIIDSGSINLDSIVKKHRILNISYRCFSPPSSARQRNEGLKHLIKKIEYVAFFDDDIILDKKALENAIAFLKQSSVDVAAISLNLTNHPPLEFPTLKAMPFVESLGLYSHKKGVVLRSGFQTLIGPVWKPTEVAWFASAAIICRRALLPHEPFDPWFEGYSYLEDLDFSYRLGKCHKLMVIPEASFIHREAQSGKIKGFYFGQKEVLNRLYFVRKNRELSPWRCVLGLIIKSGMNAFQFLLKSRLSFLLRSIGNHVGLVRLALRI